MNRRLNDLFFIFCTVYDISTLGAAMSVTPITIDQFTPVGGILQLYILHGII